MWYGMVVFSSVTLYYCIVLALGSRFVYRYHFILKIHRNTVGTLYVYICSGFSMLSPPALPRDLNLCYVSANVYIIMHLHDAATIYISYKTYYIQSI